jgi:hypothetical protein
MYLNYYNKLCEIFFYINLNIKYHKKILTIKLFLTSINEPERLAH